MVLLNVKVRDFEVRGSARRDTKIVSMYVAGPSLSHKIEHGCMSKSERKNEEKDKRKT